MFIGAGQEIGIAAGLLLEARHGVRRHRGIGVADMHVTRGVVDGRCDVKLFLFRHSGILLIYNNLCPVLQNKRPSTREGRRLRDTNPVHPNRFEPYAHNAGARRTLPFACEAPEPCSKCPRRRFAPIPALLGRKNIPTLSIIAIVSIIKWAHSFVKRRSAKSIGGSAKSIGGRQE